MSGDRVARPSDRKYFFERLADADFPAIEGLFNAVFSWKPVPPGFAHWRYASREVRGLCVGVRESSTGRVVATHGVQLLRASGGVVIGLSADVMVHPDHQRVGLGRLMEEQVRAEAENAGCAFLMCFPNARLANLRQKIPEWQPVSQARAFRIREPGSRRLAAVAARHVMADVPERIEDLWNGLRKQVPDLLGIDRSRDYLTWRFSRNPAHRYRWIVTPDPAELRGAAVTKVWLDPITKERVGDIVDFVALDRSVSETLLCAACQYLTTQSVSKITLWAPPTVSDAELTAAGFEPDPSLSRTLQVRSLVGPLQIDFPNWYLTQSDTDLY